MQWEWKSLSHVPLCDAMDYTVLGILQTRILEWVAIPFSGIDPRSPALQVDSFPAEPPGKPENAGVGSLSLLQRIFLTQESNPSLLHCRWILYQLSYQGSLRNWYSPGPEVDVSQDTESEAGRGRERQWFRREVAQCWAEPCPLCPQLFPRGCFSGLLMLFPERWPFCSSGFCCWSSSFVSCFPVSTLPFWIKHRVPSPPRLSAWVLGCPHLPGHPDFYVCPSVHSGNSR